MHLVAPGSARYETIDGVAGAESIHTLLWYSQPSRRSQPDDPE